MNTRLQLLAAVGLVTLAVGLADILPAPFGFWLGLFAAVFGPGVGLPRLLFGGGALTLPERLLITVLMSVFLTTGALAALGALGVLLTPLVVIAALLTLTYATAAAAMLRADSQAAPPLAQSPAWLAFGFGTVLATAVTVGALRLLGV